MQNEIGRCIAAENIKFLLIKLFLSDIKLLFIFFVFIFPPFEADSFTELLGPTILCCLIDAWNRTGYAPNIPSKKGWKKENRKKKKYNTNVHKQNSNKKRRGKKRNSLLLPPSCLHLTECLSYFQPANHNFLDEFSDRMFYLQRAWLRMLVVLNIDGFLALAMHVLESKVLLLKKFCKFNTWDQLDNLVLLMKLQLLSRDHPLTKQR